ncbi:single-stranded DNA-binding protein [Deinococcus pimensis]|uniref:single-stranded DNA-binding protein n=1 Tax=Deinococcus pimensis TaxID=309888 RepID=UPI0004BBF1D2|nr:single-stranded DNA-binding protein [Deinococcus pimensis]
MPQIHLTGPLGTSLTVEVQDERDIIATLRKYGKSGWTSGEIPPGGLVLPLAMADLFDWTLIGARPFTTDDGEQCVFYRGQTYKRRELDEVDTKKLKLPKIVKYSRGARPTDPTHLKEGEEGSVQYVTLITFRGGGRVIEQYVDPARQATRERA